MAELPLHEAAFTGFRMVREHPWNFVIWAALALVMSFTFIGVLIGNGGPEVMRLQQFGTSGDQNPAPIIPSLGKLRPTYVLLTPVALMFYGVVHAAMNRAVLRPSKRKFRYFGFGGDKLRQIGLMLLLPSLAIGVYIALFIIGLSGLVPQSVARAHFNVPHLIQLVSGAGASALIWPIMVTTPAAIYHHVAVRHAETIKQVLT